MVSTRPLDPKDPGSKQGDDSEMKGTDVFFFLLYLDYAPCLKCKQYVKSIFDLVHSMHTVHAAFGQ